MNNDAAMSEASMYSGSLPVSDEWVENHEGEKWRFAIHLPLDDIIDAEGIDGLNLLVDMHLGTSLADLSYGINNRCVPERINEIVVGIVCLMVTGTVDP